MTAKEEARKERLEKQWLTLEAQTKLSIKQQAVSTLASPVKEARHTASLVVARIGTIELPQGQWTELVPSLLGCLQTANDFQREATLECIGYLCEETDASVLQPYSNGLLTAIVQGLRKEEPNNQIRFYATQALLNSLEFVRGNMENEVERNYLMTVLCDATQAPELPCRERALECLVRIVQLYYDKLKPYIQALFQVTFRSVRSDSESAGLQGIEFWSTICEAELELLEADEKCDHYVKDALSHLVQLLTECLLKQSEEQDEDDWNLATAAGTCLMLAAQLTGDEIVSHIMPFISSNINHDDWKHREAAVLAFGSILDGPSQSALSPLVEQAVPMLVKHVTDGHILVKDTTVWTLGRICDLHPEHIVMKYLEPVLKCLGNALGEEPRIAAKACWAIQCLCQFWDTPDEPNPSYELTPLFQSMVAALLQAVDRKDSGEANLRNSAYEALNALLSSAADDCLESVQALVLILLQRLDLTFSMAQQSGQDRQEQSTVQGLLCGALQVVARKLGQRVAIFSDPMMQMFLKVFETRASSVHEESLMAVGAVAAALGRQFEKYMPHFAPFLFIGLRNHQEYQVCNIAVGVLVDIANALGGAIGPFCDDSVTILLENLRTMELNRDVKPTIITAFGDIALNIEGGFEKYLKVVMNVLELASQTTVPENDPEMLEYLITLRQSICEAYTGILQGMRLSKAEAFLPYVPQVLQFVTVVAHDAKMDAGVIRSCVNVIGDICNVYGKAPIVQQVLKADAVLQIVQNAVNSQDLPTKTAGEWVMTQFQRCIVN